MPLTPPRPASPSQCLPLPPPVVQHTASTGAPGPTLRQFRRLTPTEMVEHYRQRLCYNLFEPYVRGHHCQRLFYLELVDSTDDVDEATNAEASPADELEELVVSLFVGICTEDTMQIPVYIHDHRFLALLDNGSTHNFVKVMRLISFVTPNSNLRVTIANDDHVPYVMVAHNVAMHIAQEDFSINCFGINLGGFDPVLSVDYFWGTSCGTLLL